MRQWLTPSRLGLVCLALLTLWCFRDALFRGEQIAYRDAAHFYYPLYERVQQEWDAGRLPLWSPEENGGMPLLGNPTAAVLYPGKVVYALFPYPWAARIYAILHILIAAATTVLYLRQIGVSRVGAWLGALSYAFSGPILFQYCNIVFLVGAAWVPLGLHAADRWVRLGRRGAIAELAVVLALQTLGGDPQAAYLTGVCAGMYAIALAFPFEPLARRLLRWRTLLIGLLLWAGLTVTVAGLAASWPESRFWIPGQSAPRELLRHRGPFTPTPSTWRLLVLGAWVALVLRLLLRSRRRDAQTQGRLWGLGCAAIVAGLLVGAQLLPTVEFTRMTVRASSEGIHEIYPFSVEPLRLLEMLTPYPFGMMLQENRNWLQQLPPRHTVKFWVPTLYAGALTVFLAIAAIGVSRQTPARTWLLAILAVSLLSSLGMFGSPLWALRNIPVVAEVVGPHDPSLEGEHRQDAYLPDGYGSPYWMLTQLLPGFHTFRYPAKLLTFSMIALAGLAGLGWDSLESGRLPTRVRRAMVAAGVLLFTGLVASFVFGRRILDAWEHLADIDRLHSFGPFLPAKAMADTRWALVYGLLMLVASALVFRLRGGKRASWAAAAALGLLAVDLGIAHRGTVLTVPQSYFETTPEVLKVIAEAERQDPAGQPYRVHRLSLWEPIAWLKTRSDDRIADFVRWERNTIQPKYAIPLGTSYTVTEGTAELYDLWFFFAPFWGNASAEVRKAIGLHEGEKVLYFPRRGFDLWNSRYFVLPMVPSNDERRSTLAFLPGSTPIYPARDAFEGPDGPERRKQWSELQDWQVLKNNRAMPRAWIVHELRARPPIIGMRRVDRQQVMEEILYQADDFWYNPDRIVYDPTRMAWVETATPQFLAPFRPGGPPGANERVTFAKYASNEVIMDVTLDRPGVVVLADVYYPGWTLTVDGQPSEILRVNRLMRGAAVDAGRHRLVYRYQPQSVRIGAALSLAGLVSLLGIGVWARRRPSRMGGP
jgi:hypothetical protein